MENVLLLGNGFSKMLYKKMPDWSELFDIKPKISGYTLLYELYLLKNTKEGDLLGYHGNKASIEEQVKRDLLNNIQNKINIDNMNEDILSICRFGKLLQNNNVSNIITTNYDTGIEFILCEKCGYKVSEVSDLSKEKVYSIRTYKKYINSTGNHEIKLWKIHGDFERLPSIMLGFDQYCGSLSRLSNYIKGTYKSSGTNEKKEKICDKTIIKKCQDKDFDNLSWIELFFNSNLFIVGLGMNFSEIDLWWIINQRARLIKGYPNAINNKIYFLSTKYDDCDVLSILKKFDVVCNEIPLNSDYLNSIFGYIDNINN